MNAYIIPTAGLFSVLFIHMLFYARSSRNDSGFTGLLEKEENLLMDSMVVVGGIQATYFLWRSIGALSGNTWQMASFIDTIGFVLLGLFSYISYKLVTNGTDIVETYSVETSWSGKSGS